MTTSKKKTSNSKTAAKKPFNHKEALLSVLNGQYASDYDLTDDEDLSELKECLNSDYPGLGDFFVDNMDTKEFILSKLTEKQRKILGF